MKLIKLLEDPGLPETPLFTAASGDIPERIKGSWQYATGTLIGWGVGRSLADPDGLPTWNWGGDATMAKRWGTNRIEGSVLLEYTFGNIYNFVALETNLSADAGDNEAAAAIYDSGSGIFIEDEGIWKLAGITVTVSKNGSSTFSNLSGDSNYFARINQYAAEIEAAIPNTATPSGWKIDHSLYGTDADNTADTDFDGIPQLLEFAFGGDPHVNDISILPTHALVEEGGNTYLELTVTRPIGLQGITYTPQTTTDLITWPSDSTGIVNPAPTPQDNGNGTETLIYRRAEAVANAELAFIRVAVTENP
jgi:hypothetical protein